MARDGCGPCHRPMAPTRWSVSTSRVSRRRFAASPQPTSRAGPFRRTSGICPRPGLTGGDDRVDARRTAGLLVGFLGVATLVGFDVSGGNLGAVGEIAVVTVGYALGPVIIARRLGGVPAVGVVTASLVLTAIVYAPVGVAQLPQHAPSVQVMLAVAALGVVCTAVAFLLFFALIAEVGPVRATVITYVNPAVALALGVLVLGEPFTAGAAAGFVLILAGSFLATRRAPSAAARRAGSQEAEPVAPLAGVP